MIECVPSLLIASAVSLEIFFPDKIPEKEAFLQAQRKFIMLPSKIRGSSLKIVCNREKTAYRGSFFLHFYSFKMWISPPSLFALAINLGLLKTSSVIQRNWSVSVIHLS